MKKLLLSLLLFPSLLWSATANTPRLGLMMPSAGDENWDVPILANYNILDSSAVLYPITISSGITGVIPSANLVSTVAYTTTQNVFTTEQDFTTVAASSVSVSGNVNIASLSANQCVQTGAGGLLTTSGASCGSGGGSSVLGVNQNGVSITSPTKALNGLSPPFLITSVGAGATAQWTLDSSSVTLFGTNVVRLQSSLQSGATFFVSSGTVRGPLYVSTLTATNGVLADTLRATGTGGLTVDNLTSGRCVKTTTGGLLMSADVDCSLSTGSYINNTSTLQSGATFYVSSGTVSGSFNAGLNNTTSTMTVRGYLIDKVSQSTLYDPHYLYWNTIAAGSGNTTIGFAIGSGLGPPNLQYALGFTNTSSANAPNTGFGVYNPFTGWQGGFDTSLPTLNGFEINTAGGQNTFDVGGNAMIGLDYMTPNSCGFGGIPCSYQSPANGLVVQGDTLIGTPSEVSGTSKFQVMASSNNAYVLWVGTNTTNAMLSISTNTGVTSGTAFTASGYFQLASKTIAQIAVITPLAVAEEYYCSNCATVSTCISTGTAQGAFALITNKGSGCQ